jgi:hypothetical protein
VLKQNPAARFHERLGFRIVGESVDAFKLTCVET